MTGGLLRSLASNLTETRGEVQRLSVVEIAVPVFGYKNHLGIDRPHGFIRRFTVTHTARYDGSQLAALLDIDNAASGVWVDAAYRSKANLRLLDRRRLVAQIQRAEPRGRPMPPHIARGNATRAQVRARVYHVFAVEKHGMGLLIRTVGQLSHCEDCTGQSHLHSVDASRRKLSCCCRRHRMRQSTRPVCEAIIPLALMGIGCP